MMFLSAVEIQQLTSRKRSSTQIEVLRQQRIPHAIDGDGRPVVLRAALLEHMLGKKVKSHEPDWSHVA